MNASSQAGRENLLRVDSSVESRQLFLRLHVVHIPVRDHDRSLQFYRDQLGFRVAIDIMLPSGDRWIVVSPPDGSAGLALVKDSQDPPAHKPVGGLTGITFITEDVFAKYEEWSARNVQFKQPPLAPAWGGGQAQFEIFEDLDKKPQFLVNQLRAQTF